MNDAEAMEWWERWREIVDAESTFDIDESCRTCGAQVQIEHQVKHFEWHETIEVTDGKADNGNNPDR